MEAVPSSSASPAASSSSNPTSLNTLTQEQQQNLIELINAVSKGATTEQAQQTISQLIKTGKLPQSVLSSVLKVYQDKLKASQQQAASKSSTTPTPASSSSNSGMKTASGAEQVLGYRPPSEGDSYPISQNLSPISTTPVQWPQTRPTLTGGMSSGRVSGTPAVVARQQEELAFDEYRVRQRKNTPGEVSMRRTISDLVASVDPNVKIEPEVEDLLLNIADEFIDSVTNFACRLAKHRGGDTLEVRDLQLHLERNHNIRIPGFASDETRISLSQSVVAPAPAPPQKKTTTGTHMTLRSARLAQVAQAKRDGKLL